MIKHIWFDFSNTISKYGMMSYQLTDPDIPEVLEEIRKITPVSIFSNVNVRKILPALNIDSRLFTHILTSSMLENPKPALDGFYKMIELSALPAEKILYVGDNLREDILPAKSLEIKTGTVFEKIEQADYSFKDFKDILEFVKEGNK